MIGDSAAKKPEGADGGKQRWSDTLRALLDQPERKPTSGAGEAKAKPRRDDWDVGTPEGDRRSAQLWRKAGTPKRALEEALTRVRGRYMLDRTAAIDQLSGRAFSGVRQAQLLQLPEAGHLATGYGLKAAGQPDMGDLKRASGIRIAQDLSTGYMREQLPEDEEASPFPALYQMRTGRAPGKQVRYLNSTLAFEKMLALTRPDLDLSAMAAPLALPSDDKPVCWAIEIPATLTEKTHHIDELMHESGATPSTHSALQKLAGLAGGQPAAVPRSGAAKQAARAGAFASGPGQRLATLPADHPGKATAESARHLLEGLKISPEAAADGLVKNALATMDRLIQGMALCVDEAGRLNQLYELFMEEIFLVTARARPYEAKDYRDSATKALKQRAPAMAGLSADVKVQPFLVASGMDALSTALVGARAQHGAATAVHRDEQDNTYFENIFLLDHSALIKEKGPIMVATLNGSTPMHGDKPKDDSEGLIARIAQKLLQFPDSLVTLILDVTIEIGAPGGETDLNLVFASGPVQAALDAGLLQITLCKSYQKYSTMGTGKVMAGNVTLVGKTDTCTQTAERLARSVRERDAMNSDEAQLMTHLLAQGADDELALLNHAAANARAVQASSWPPPKDGEGFQDGLPFLMAPVEVDIQGARMSTTELCARMGLDQRESFSFQQSSFLLAGSSVRINTGQESEGGALEKLHAVGMALKGPVDGAVLKSSVDADLKGMEKSKDRFALSKTASKLLMSVRVIADPAPEARKTLNEQMRQLLAFDDKAGPGTERLTAETRAALQAACARLALDELPSAESARTDREIVARKDTVAKALRDAYAEGGSQGGWETKGGRKIVSALSAFEKKADAATAQALVQECETWLAEHPRGDSARPEVEALLTKARRSAGRLTPERARELVRNLGSAEDVGQFLLDEGGAEALVDRPEGQALLDEGLKRLDLNSRIALLAQVSGKPRPKLKAALLARLGPILDADAPPTSLAPETLADTSEDAPAPRMDAARFQRAHQDYIAAQHRDWAALVEWLKKPDYADEPWVKRLQKLAGGFDALAAEIARIAALPLRRRRLDAEAPTGLSPTLAEPYAQALKLKVDELVRIEDERLRAVREAEEKRIAAEQLAQRLRDYDAMTVPALIDACPDGAGIADRVKAFDQGIVAALANVAGTVPAAWRSVASEWQKLASLLQGLDKASAEAQARRQLLERKLGELFALASAEPAFVNAHAPVDTAWKERLIAAVEQLGVLAKQRILLKINEQLKDDVADMAAAGRALRELLRAANREPERTLAADDSFWPA